MFSLFSSKVVMEPLSLSSRYQDYVSCDGVGDWDVSSVSFTLGEDCPSSSSPPSCIKGFVISTGGTEEEEEEEGEGGDGKVTFIF